MGYRSCECSFKHETLLRCFGLYLFSLFYDHRRMYIRKSTRYYLGHCSYWLDVVLISNNNSALDCLFIGFFFLLIKEDFCNAQESCLSRMYLCIQSIYSGLQIEKTYSSCSFDRSFFFDVSECLHNLIITPHVIDTSDDGLDQYNRILYPLNMSPFSC